MRKKPSVELTDTLNRTAEAWRATKASVCAKEGPADLEFQLEMVTPDEHHFVTLVPERELIAPYIHAVRTQQPLAWVAACSDAYYRRVADPADLPGRGALADAFATGDASVAEALVVMVMDANSGQALHRTMPYHYEGRDVVFETDTSFDDAQATGMIPFYCLVGLGFSHDEAEAMAKLNEYP